MVALDPRTGAILAMVSYPGYDPNKIDSQWKDIIADPDKPLINRATSGLYPPGSVFKMVVASAGLQTGTVTPETEFVDTGSVTLGGYEVNNFGDKVYGKHTFAKAFASSINTTFAKLGVDLGANTLAATPPISASASGSPGGSGGPRASSPIRPRWTRLTWPRPLSGRGPCSRLRSSWRLLLRRWLIEGKIMKPYIVDQVLSYNGALVDKTSPGVWLNPISAATAATMRDLMIEVVNSGTGTAAALKGVQVAGKTGTAEVVNNTSHAWFAGFAPAGDPKVAVVVLVENGGSGGSVAAPIARQVIAAALGL